MNVSGFSLTPAAPRLAWISSRHHLEDQLNVCTWLDTEWAKMTCASSSTTAWAFWAQLKPSVVFIMRDAGS